MRFRLVEHEQSRTVELPTGVPVVFGRQTEAEMKDRAIPLQDESGTPGTGRFVMAWAAEYADISQEHVAIEALPDGQVRITNRSARFTIRVSYRIPPSRFVRSRNLEPSKFQDLKPPFSIRLPRRTITVEAESLDSIDALNLSQQTLAPGQSLLGHAGVRPAPSVEVSDTKNLMEWLQATLGVLQLAIGSDDFLKRAVEALVEIVELDAAYILLLKSDGWDLGPVASYSKFKPLMKWQPSKTVLNGIISKKIGIYSQRPIEDPASPEIVYRDHSSMGKGAVVAAPLLDSAGDVIGVLYGECHIGDSGPDALRMALVKLLSSGVSAGLARQTKELEAAQEAARFEAFFSKSLAAKLRQQPDMLKGKKAIVTILFCDIRGYSTISTKLNPETAEKWLHDVLGELSRCILDEDGVVVDYIGDEVMAMWGAPEEQPDQTERALRAGLAMVRALSELNSRWKETLWDELDLGVGIHRGEARVGNCGTATKFKYGALGDTVNRASRVQGMTKYLKCRVLMTGAAAEALTPKSRSNTRRVVLTRLAGIDQPVHLFEAVPKGEDRAYFADSVAALDTLEGALEVLEAEKRFDSKAFSNAAQQAGKLLVSHLGDGPLLLTLSRATEALIRDGQGCTKVWTSPGK